MYRNIIIYIAEQSFFFFFCSKIRLAERSDMSPLFLSYNIYSNHDYYCYYDTTFWIGRNQHNNPATRWKKNRNESSRMHICIYIFMIIMILTIMMCAKDRICIPI